MRRNAWIATIVALMAWVSGCAEEHDIPGPLLEVLQNGNQYELLSLDPTHERGLTTNPATTQAAERFHDYKILGRTSIEDAASRKQLNEALRAGAKENTGMVAMCFNPRHGIHVVRDGKSMDFVICFECMQVAVYENDKRIEGFLVTGSPQPIFDDVLTKAGVPLPKH